MLEAQLQIHVRTSFAHHIHYQTSRTISEVAYVNQMSSEFGTFSVMH